MPAQSYDRLTMFVMQITSVSIVGIAYDAIRYWHIQCATYKSDKQRIEWTGRAAEVGTCRRTVNQPSYKSAEYTYCMPSRRMPQHEHSTFSAVWGRGLDNQERKHGYLAVISSW